MDILGCLFILLTILRTFCYPLKDIFGSSFCYVFAFIELFLDFLLNLQTFFTILYRYICLNHENILLFWRISPKTLAKVLLVMILALGLLIPICALFSTNTFTLQTCLGNYILTYNRNGYNNTMCTNGNYWLNLVCTFSFSFVFILSSNIPETYMLYKSYQKIQKQTEQAKTMIGDVSYFRRRRDDGIVIRISICQWFVELCNFVLYYIYIIFFIGWSLTLDNFFNLYLLAFQFILQPGFYISANGRFRLDVANHGLFFALKNALK